MRRRRFTIGGGFTLLELLVVVTIVSLVAATAVLKLGGGLRRAQLRRATEVVTEIDRHARQLAVRGASRCELRILVTDGVFELSREGVGEDEFQRRWQLAPPIGITSAATPRESRTSGDVVVRYGPHGRSDTYAVSVGSPSGEPRWLLVAGGTGQIIEDLSEREIERVLRGLQKNRHNAD